MNAPTLSSARIHRRERRLVDLQGHALREDGSMFPVRVLDLSYEGCGIEANVELSAGESLKLSVLRRGGIDCRVRWWSNGRAGLVFEPEAETAKPLKPRHSKRVSLDAEVSLRRLGQLNYRVRLFDASPDGCKVELVERPRIGEHVLIKLPGIEALDSEVCWVEGFVAGLRYQRPMHPAVFDLLLVRLMG